MRGGDCRGFINTGPTAAVVLVILALIVLARFWGVLPFWARAAAVVLGAIVLALGLFSGRNSWPNLDLPPEKKDDDGGDGSESERK